MNKQDFDKNEKRFKAYDDICPFYSCEDMGDGTPLGVCKVSTYKYAGEIRHDVCTYPFRKCMHRTLNEDMCAAFIKTKKK